MLSPDPIDRPSSAIDALARLNEACRTGQPLVTADDRAARLGSGRSGPAGIPSSPLSARRGRTVRVGGVVWLAGDAGSGKTRLFGYLAAKAAGLKGGASTLPPARSRRPQADFLSRASAPTRARSNARPAR